MKPAARSNNLGLQAAFTSIFPITSHNGFARLRFAGYELAEPEFDVAECQLRGLTYSSRLRAKIRLKSTIARLLSLRPLRKFVRTTSIWAKCL